MNIIVSIYFNAKNEREGGNETHTEKCLSNSSAGLGITKRGTGKPLRVWSLLHERDKSRNGKLAAIRMAGAFVHWRQVGNLVFNDQLLSLRFTFQSPPFSPQLTSPKLCLILSLMLQVTTTLYPASFCKICPSPLLYL